MCDRFLYCWISDCGDVLCNLASLTICVLICWIEYCLGFVHSKVFWTISVSRGRTADENTGKIPIMNLSLDAFTKQLQEVTISFIMSVCMFILKYFDQIQFCLKSDRYIGHFIWKHAWIMIKFRWILFAFKKGFRRSCRENKKHVLCQIHFTYT